MKNKKKNNLIVKIVLTIMLLSMIGALVGCGFESPKNSSKSGDLWIAERTDGGYSVKNGGSPEDVYGIVDAGGFLEMKPTTAYKRSDNSSGIAAFRSFTRLLYSSIFSTVTVTPSDIGATIDVERAELPDENLGIYYKLETPESAPKLCLHPLAVCLRVTNKTSEILADGGDGNRMISDIAKVLQSAVIAILVCMWMANFLQQIIQERFTFESMLKGFCQLLLGCAIVLNAIPIVNAFFKIGDSIITSVATVSGMNVGDHLGAFKTYIDGIISGNTLFVGVALSLFNGRTLGFMMWLDIGSLLSSLILILPFIGQILCAYQIVSQLFTRMIELVIRISFAPIPLAFGSMNGFGPSTLSFIKSTVACAVHPALIIVACLCFDGILDIMVGAFSLDGIMGTFAGSFFIMIAFIILSGFIGQTKQLSQEIIAR